VVAGRPRPVINATGIVLHTNLGRAPVAEEEALRQQAAAPPKTVAPARPKN
jgi:L-seryl-tRNA(Ser) seleniumtransferase